MSTREERDTEARDEARTSDRDCIGCALGLCYDDHNIDCYDSEDDA